MKKDLQTAAIENALQGFKILPCKQDKSPLTPNGFKDATDQVDQVSDWWKRWPDALIGFPCRINGVLGIDIDNKNGVDGNSEWKTLVEANGGNEVSASWVQRTRSGGYHLFFKHPDFDISKGKLAPGIDVRSKAYVIISPSPGYTWVDGLSPNDNELTLPPELLINLLKPHQVEPKTYTEYPEGDKAKWAAELLTRLDPRRCDDYFEWVNVGMALSELGETGFNLWDSWSQNSQKYKVGECAKKWKGFDPGHGLTLGSLYHWAEEDDPRPKVSEGSEPPPPDEPEAEPMKPGKLKTSWTVDELLTTDFPEPKWAVPGLLPEGLTVFGGRPKVGKSWFMLQTSWGVATGGKLFDRDVERGSVLYLALEDNPRRLSQRLKDMGVGLGTGIEFETLWKPLHKEGMSLLAAKLNAKDYRLVVIDTLTRAIAGVNQGKEIDVVGRVFANLQYMAMSKNIAVVMIDHTRKPSGFTADPIDDMLHTTEKTAIADAILALYKEQGRAGAMLLGRGREIEDIELSLEWSPDTRCWHVEGPIVTERDDEVISALEALGKCQVGDIAKATGQNRGNAYKRLVKLVDQEIVKRTTTGKAVFYELL
jgi:hypothetical protein